MIVVERPAEEILDPVSIPSLQGKPIVDAQAIVTRGGSRERFDGRPRMARLDFVHPASPLAR
jgi:hypothetical protein